GTRPRGCELSAGLSGEREQKEVCLEQRGVVWARVLVGGRMAHGAMPEAGANPISAIGALLAEVPTLEKRLGRLSERSRYLKPPTVTPTVLQSPAQGVGQSNVIPSSARLTLDVRLTPGPHGDAVARELDAACQRAMARCPGATIEWAPINGFRLP